MKIRSGFVSNSSSSSFALGKVYMNEEQINAFRNWIKGHQGGWHEGCIGETAYYFQGEFSMHEYDNLRNFLAEIGVDPKYVGEYV